MPVKITFELNNNPVKGKAKALIRKGQSLFYIGIYRFVPIGTCLTHKEMIAVLIIAFPVFSAVHTTRKHVLP